MNSERLALDHTVKFKFDAALVSDFAGFFFKQSVESVERFLGQGANV